MMNTPMAIIVEALKALKRYNVWLRPAAHGPKKHLTFNLQPSTFNPAPASRVGDRRSGSRVAHHAARFAFSMVELLVAMTLLSLIVLVLMTVFNSTQRAFRASVTQTDILEGSRAAMDLITTDLRGLTPSDGVSNYVSLGNNNYSYGAANLFVTNNTYEYMPLMQPLPGGNMLRTNLLQYFFVLGRRNMTWTGAGYIVDCSSANPLFPLYRFYAETNISANPVVLYWNFLNTIYGAQWTNMSHVMDGVVHLVVRGYDPSGYWLTNGYGFQHTKRTAKRLVLAAGMGRSGLRLLQQRRARRRRGAARRARGPHVAARPVAAEYCSGVCPIQLSGRPIRPRPGLPPARDHPQC